MLLLFTAVIVVVFGQMRFDRTTGYSAIFSNSSGLRAGQFVRASGVEVGKVKDVKLIEGGSKARVDFDVERSLELFEESTASVRYLNLIGDRYLELKRGDSDRRMPSGGTIPVERTEPALDLDALIGGFRPLFRALHPYYAREPLSGEGAGRFGGRFNRQGRGALYLARDFETLRYEIARGGAFQPSVIVELRADITGLFDARDAAALASVGFAPEDLGDPASGAERVQADDRGGGAAFDRPAERRDGQLRRTLCRGDGGE